MTAYVAVNAEFGAYSGGVFSDASCMGIALNHGVNLVGYGTSPDAGDYFILRNSWGTGWGKYLIF